MKQNTGKTITLPNPPSSWGELSKEQLIFIHSLNRSEMPFFVYKMRVFLELCGLELCGQSYYEEPDITDEDSVDNIEKRLQWMGNALVNKVPIVIILRKKAERNSPLMRISCKNLFDAIDYFTEFLENPFTLIDCKIDKIRIGQHTYAGPDPMMLSLTYEQYKDAQSALEHIGYIQDRLVEKNEEVKNAVAEVIEKSPQSSNDEILDRIGEERLKEIRNYEKELRDAQGDFLAAILCLMEVKLVQEEQYDVKGELITDAQGIPVMKAISFWKSKSYDSEEMKRIKEELIENAPAWLFPLLLQWFQSSLAALKTRFPKLFKDNQVAGEESDPLKSFVQTLNALMKEQGYTSQRDVLNTEAVLNFETLNRLAVQAEELDRINKKK